MPGAAPDLAALHDALSCCATAADQAWRGDQDSAWLSLFEAHAAAEEAFGRGSPEVEALNVVFAAITQAAHTKDQSASRGTRTPRLASDLSRLGQERTMTNLTTMNGAPAARLPRAGETFICCETPMPWPTRTDDRTCPECGTVWEHDGVDLSAGARIKPGLAPEAGLDLARQALAGRPYWLTGPCPGWCAYPEDHQPSDHPDDRVHMGGTWDVTLTLEDPAVNLPRNPAGQIEVGVPHLDIYLRQGWREYEPRVELSVNDESGISLTLAEAADLAGALAGLVRQAGGMPS